MIGGKITCISESLIEGRARRVKGALQFKDGNAAPLEDNDVRSSGVTWQFVLEDGGVFVCRRVPDFEFTTLALQPGDGLVPGSDLLGRGVVDELLQSEADYARLGTGELREARAPSVAAVWFFFFHGSPGSLLPSA